MDFLDILLSSVIGAVGGFFLSYLGEKGKNFATKEDISGITKKQAEIHNKYDSKLEVLKGEIQRTVFEYDTRYAYLHKRRGEVIDQIYKKVDKTIRLFGAAIRSGRFNFESSPEAQREEASKNFWELMEYFYQNRLYLDEDLCVAIEQFFSSVFNIESNLGTASSLETFLATHNPQLTNQYVQFLEEAGKHINNDLPPIRNLIEKKMRNILGINREIGIE